MPRNKGLSEIRKLHIARGFKDVGYHFVISANGRVWKGRPIEEEGAHVKSDNAESIGICVCGNFEAYPPLTAQIKALKKLIYSLCKEFGKLEVLGHRDYPQADTVCPGRYLYELIPTLVDK